MRKILIIIICLLLNKAYAQDIQIPTTVKNLTEQSFQKYPKILEMQDLVHLSEIKVNLSRAGFFPIASGDISYRHISPTDPISIPMGPGVTGNISIMPADNFNAGAIIVQPLIDFKTPANINKSKSELTTSSDNLESFKFQLAYQIAQLYYGIIFLNKSLVVQSQQLDLIQSNIKQIEVKVKNGDALTFDLVSMQVKYTNIENFYTDLQNQLTKQYNMLEMLSGNSGSAYISDTTIDYSGFDLVSDSIFAVASRNNMDLKIANDKISSAKWDVITSKRTQIPTLNLLAGAGYKNGFLPDISAVRFNYYIGAAISIPIFSGSRPYYQKKMALINLDASTNALETQRSMLNKDILNALADMEKSEKKLLGSDMQINQATLALKLADERYKEGVITTLELLTAQTSYQDALLSKLQYQYNLLVAKLEINRLAGKRWW